MGVKENNPVHSKQRMHTQSTNRRSYMANYYMRHGNRMREWAKRYYDKNREALKIARTLSVSLPEAREMLERQTSSNDVKCGSMEQSPQQS